MSYNLGEIAQLLNRHSTKADIRLLLADLIGQGYDRPEFQNYDDLEGQSRLEKILTILQVMQGFGDDKVCLVCETMKDIRSTDEELHNGIESLLQPGQTARGWPGADAGQKEELHNGIESLLQQHQPNSGPPHKGSVNINMVMTLAAASGAFLSLLFGIVAIFKFGVGGNIAPRDFIILTPTAVVLALVLYPFILVLLNIFTSQMAQQQFNALHSFVEATFPSLIGWLNKLSHFFEKQPKSNK